MARIDGVTRGGSLLARIAFFMTRRRLGKVIRPIRIHALHGRLLYGLAQMELAQEKLHTVPTVVKSLAQLRTAMVIGCPF